MHNICWVMYMNSNRTFFVRNKKALIISILISEGVGFLSSFFVRGRTEWYGKLNRPPLSPPGWLFPIVWGILFLLMGIAAYRIYISGSENRKNALWIYAAQLIFNFFWPLFFFTLGAFGFAAIWLAVLLVLALSTFGWFFTIDRPAAYLFIPYLVWLAFALYLNVGIWILN